MYKAGIVAGVFILILGVILNFLVMALVPSLASQYQNTSIFRPWSDPLMMLYFAYPFIVGFVLFYLWKKVTLHGNGFDKALNFAKVYFVIATIPGMFITYTSFQLSLLMIIVWAINGFLQALVAGLIFVRMVK